MRKIAITLLIAWMAVIFYLSTDAGAYTGVYNIQVMRVFKDNFGIDVETVKVAGYSLIAVARKCMHFALYAVMGFLAYNAVRHFKVKYKYLLAVAITAIYALFDEMHQIFVPARTSSMTDVIIDTIGAMSAVCFVYISSKINRLVLQKSEDQI